MKSLILRVNETALPVARYECSFTKAVPSKQQIILFVIKLATAV